MRLVSVVTRTRSCFFTLRLISDSRSSTWVDAGRTTTCGSMRPVGRTTCSTTCPECCRSYSAGVAETKTVWRTTFSNSSKRSGRLSSAEGRRKPYSTRFLLREGSALSMPARQVPRIVLDALAEAELGQHFQVEARALFDALRLDQPAGLLEKLDAAA